MTGEYFREEIVLPKIKDDFHVYLMQRRIDRGIKIGYSRNPVQRCSAIEAQQGCTVRLIKSLLVGTRGQATDLESLLHETLDSRRIKGEWFRLEDDEIEALAWSMPDRGMLKRALVEIISRPFIGRSMCTFPE